VLLNPSEYYPIIIRNRGAYIGFKAYWFEHGPEKMFNIVFNKFKLYQSLRPLNKNNFETLNVPVYIKFRYVRQLMEIKEYKVL